MHLPHRLALLAFPPVQMLDIAGPMDVFSVANQISVSVGLPPLYEVVLAAPCTGPLLTTSGVSLVATQALRDLEPDTLLIAGGPGARAMINDKQLVSSLTELCMRTQRVGSICTGAFPLAATGVLNRRRATTHWYHFDEFAAAFPGVNID